MTFFDIGLLSLIGIFALKGFMKGAIRESISLVILFASLFVAPIFANSTGRFVSNTFSLNFSEDVIYFLGIGVIILLMIIIGFLISLIMNILMKTTGLKLLDRILGIVIGSVKIILIISIFVTLSFKVELSKQYLVKYTEKSTYFKQVLSIGDKIIVRANNIKSEIVKNKSSIEKNSSNIANQIIDKTNLKEKVEVLKKDGTVQKITDNVKNGLNDLEQTIKNK